MATGVQELKLAARMQEWLARIAECRSSGMSVRAWCKEQGIAIQTYYHWEKRFVTEATQQLSLPAPTQAGMLMQVNPDTLPSGDVNARHQEHARAMFPDRCGSKHQVPDQGCLMAFFFGQSFGSLHYKTPASVLESRGLLTV